MEKVKLWLISLNPEDELYCKLIKNSNSFEELEKLASPVVSEIGWLNLSGLSEIM